jgi:predicted RNA-binding protein with PIN domain
MTESDRLVRCDALPAAVRAKMVALASQGLAKMPTAQVPGSLRKSVSFAPAKRAKLVGPQLAAAVELDEEFRGHLATQVRALVPETAAALDSGEPQQAPSLVEAAATAYIIRSDGWADVVDSAVLESSVQTGPQSDLAGTVERLSAALADARGDVKAVRARYRVQVDALKAENAQLRRALGQVRVQLKEESQRADGAAEAAGQHQQTASAATRSLEAEVRRLRTRISELEAHNASARRALRDDRGAEVMRLRLLLDTMVEAVAGLRRELALPPTDLLPADTVAAVEPGPDSLVAGVGRALLDDDPSLLRRLLELPKVHLIVDGYNVSMTAWPTAPLDQQRERLATRVGFLVGGKGVETTIVFDGAELLHPPVMSSRRAVRIRFSPQGIIADDVIRELVEAEPTGRPVVVVTTDRELATSVTKKGARAVASMALIRAMGT